MLLQDTQYQGTYLAIVPIKSYAQVSLPLLLDWSRTRLLDQLGPWHALATNPTRLPQTLLRAL